MAYKRRLKFDKRIKFKKKMDIMYILLLIVLASIGTGYAYIKSDLNINGTANVTAANWDVHFENLNVTAGSVTATTPADITDDTTVEFAATLEEPNDYYEFTVDVVNDGTMDAMIDSFSISPTLTTAQANYLEYTIEYSDGTPLVNEQELRQGTSETIKVRFSYIENSDKTNYPTTDQSFNIEFSVNYTQADGSEIEVDHPRTVYTVNTSSAIQIGQAMPAGITQYDTAAEAMAAFSNRPFYLKNVVHGGIVLDTCVEFVITSAMANANSGMTAGTYTLRGIDTSYYDTNVATLISAFGSSRCTDYTTYYKCSITDISARVYKNGFVDALDDSWFCNVGDQGTSTSICGVY